MKIAGFIKKWMLPLAMLTGASIYLIYHYLPGPVHHASPVLSGIVGIMQPLLIFAMLFLTFCHIEPRELRPHRWHLWLLLVQGGVFTVLGAAAWALLKFQPVKYYDFVVLLESAMLCFITPTATAAAVVTRKLGGNVPGITTYIILVNLLTATLVPLIVPLIHPENGVSFASAFSMILAKVFPLLITPCLSAWLVRYLLPGLLRHLLRHPDLPFYLWGVALTLAIAVTTKSIVKSDMSVVLMVWIAVISLLCCVIQFSAGRRIGGNSSCSDKVTAGQSLGQKNTIFSIWMGYTFMTPETAIVGGFYSVWHNIYNSWQLRRAGKDTTSAVRKYQ